MQEAIDILRHSETVLVKKIKAMKDGKPKYAASDKLNELRDAIKALQDYEICFEALYPYADYMTVNISSPNTPGLRDMQTGEALMWLLLILKEKLSAYI